MKRIAAALGVGLLTAGLLITCFYPSITQVPLIGKFDRDDTQFIPIWKAAERSFDPLWLTGEVVLGLFAFGLVLAATGNKKRDPPRIR